MIELEKPSLPASSWEATRQHIDIRFDHLEEKLDKQLERVSKSEVEVAWLKTVAKYMAMVVLAVVGKLAHLSFLKP